MTDIGLDGELKGWIEASSDGFQRDGHYYILAYLQSRIVVQKMSVRHGLLAGVENAWPNCRLIPAVIVFKKGLHVRVSPDTGCTCVINPAITPSEQQGLVIRDRVKRKEDPDGFRMDMYLPRPESAEAETEQVAQRNPRLFISYSHVDLQLCKRLLVSLQGLASVVSRKCLCIVIGASRRSNRLWQPTLPV